MVLAWRAQRVMTLLIALAGGFAAAWRSGPAPAPKASGAGSKLRAAPKVPTGAIAVHRGNGDGGWAFAFSRGDGHGEGEGDSESGDYPDKVVERRLPEQGYTRNHSRADNPPVHHQNWETATADWGQEYGPSDLHHGDGPTDTHGPDYPPLEEKPKPAAPPPASSPSPPPPPPPAPPPAPPPKFAKPAYSGADGTMLSSMFAVLVVQLALH